MLLDYGIARLSNFLNLFHLVQGRLWVKLSDLEIEPNILRDVINLVYSKVLAFSINWSAEPLMQRLILLCGFFLVIDMI